MSENEHREREGERERDHVGVHCLGLAWPYFSSSLLQIWLTVNKLIALNTANKGDATAAVVVVVAVGFSPFCLNKTI